MSEFWVRTRFHEAGHSVIAWCRGNRPEVIGDITVARENGRVVAKAGVHTDHISPNQLSFVGLAGLPAEAKAAVEKKHAYPAAFRLLTALAYQIRECGEQRLANLVPFDAWSINVDVAPEPKMTPGVLTADDL